ncbi:ribosomal protein L32 [Kwoniella heveanensis BCC8398]|uniref:Large ribosomal subunit protein bL32m n=1 Tax=Kwoniella heveanensis BCC8398 TaxID=1296120 RepID=A0A1B9GUJ7_9TREE|nr:ribosomal protein L32 [Kwoniella heveanensis BCC8398]
MAALTAPSTRGSFRLSRQFSFRPLIASSLRPSWSIPCEASSSSTILASVQPVAPLAPAPTSRWASIFPSSSLESLLELIPPIVWASVPKKKTSHSRKSMRAANKGLKNKTNISLCEACGSIRLTHHVCPTCYSQISRRWKRDARGEGAGQPAIEQRQAAEP